MKKKKINGKKCFDIIKTHIAGENYDIVRDENYVYIPYIFDYLGNWDNSGLYLAIPLNKIKRIDERGIRNEKTT